MHSNLITPDQPAAYSTKEIGPIIVALAFVIGVGGVAAAAILICGWQHIKSVGVNILQKHVEIVCK